MGWFKRKPQEPPCAHRWVYSSVRHLRNTHTGRVLTEYARACPGCHAVETGVWGGKWTLEFLESDLGQAAMRSEDD